MPAKILTRPVELWNSTWRRLSRGRPFVATVAVGVVGLFGAGTATGWLLADRYSPRSAPDIQVVVATGTAQAGTEGVTMPDLRGLGTADARQVLVDVGLRAAAVAERQQPWVGAPGRVVAQEPVAGQAAPSQITLVISAPAVVPAVVGTDVTEATRALQALGADVVVRRVYREGTPADRVLEVSPAAGAAVTSRVDVVASAPAATMDLTDLKAQKSDCSRGQDLVVNGNKHATGLTCRGGKDFVSAVYLLGRKTAQLTVVLGQPDTTEPGSKMLLEVVTDGVVVASQSLAYGESKAITVATAGVLRLELRARLDPPPTGSARGTAVFADLQLVGGGAELLAVKGLTP